MRRYLKHIFSFVAVVPVIYVPAPVTAYEEYTFEGYGFYYGRIPILWPLFVND